MDVYWIVIFVLSLLNICSQLIPLMEHNYVYAPQVLSLKQFGHSWGVSVLNHILLNFS